MQLKKRDYKKEYRKFQSTPAQKKTELEGTFVEEDFLRWGWLKKGTAWIYTTKEIELK